MRRIIEQVDEFIEEYFDGSIISFLHGDIDESSKKRPKIVFMDKETKDSVSTRLGILVNSQIPEYLRLKDSDKERLALEIFSNVVLLRTFGVIANNPENPRELEFYKAECKRQQEAIEEKDKEITGLLRAIQDLRAGAGAIR